MYKFEILTIVRYRAKASKDPVVIKLKWVEIIVLRQRNGHQRLRGVKAARKQCTPGLRGDSTSLAARVWKGEKLGSI